MSLKGYTPEKLFNRLITKENFLLLDVRNETEFGRFKVEGPYPFDMMNLPYIDFMEWEDESVKKVPNNKPINIVCAKEGSAKYVGEILANHGFEHIEYLLGGIKTWGNMLTPVRINQDDDYELYQFIRPGKASCSYGLIQGKEMMVFDPAKNISFYQDFAQKAGAAIIKTFETHRQADYISGTYGLHQESGAEIMVPEPDFEPAKFSYTPVKDGDIYTFSKTGPNIKVIHTPGHTPGSTSYLIDEKFLISGDAVFIHSIGRPDLGGQAEEWAKMLFNTVQNKILTWDDNMIILPGHYMDWKEADDNLAFAAPIGKIKEINAEIYSIDNEDDFIAYIKENIRPQPEEYAKIREINANLIDADDETRDILDLGKNECAASTH